MAVLDHPTRTCELPDLRSAGRNRSGLRSRSSRRTSVGCTCSFSRRSAGRPTPRKCCRTRTSSSGGRRRVHARDELLRVVEPDRDLRSAQASRTPGSRQAAFIARVRRGDRAGSDERPREWEEHRRRVLGLPESASAGPRTDRTPYAPGESGKSAAEDLGRPVNAVYQSLGRIRRTLLECVNRQLGGTVAVRSGPACRPDSSSMSQHGRQSRPTYVLPRSQIRADRPARRLVRRAADGGTGLPPGTAVFCGIAPRGRSISTTCTCTGLCSGTPPGR